MASLLRFRHSTDAWSVEAVEDRVFRPLDANLGATMTDPWYEAPAGFEARRFDVDNGDTALFAWNETEAFWIGNTETPESLWRTEKISFETAPYQVTRWAQRELLAQLHEESPWLEAYPHLSWFFLPVFLSKDGRETSRRFLKEHAAGFPREEPDVALDFYEEFLSTGVLDDHRHLMAGKLGTSDQLNLTRMTAAMGEFNTAYLLVESGYAIEPEAEVSTGHSIDFRATGPDGTALVEVTRPAPPRRRAMDSAVAALRSTASTKVNGQLDAHGGGVLLFVDCSSFSDADWAQVMERRPAVGHKPAVVYRLEPDGQTSGYPVGNVPLELSAISEPAAP